MSTLVLLTIVAQQLASPAMCKGLASTSKTTARFVQQGVDWVIELDVTLPTRGAWVGSHFATGASATSMRLTDVVALGRTFVAVAWPVACRAGVGYLSVWASFPSGPSAKAPITVTLHDI